MMVVRRKESIGSTRPPRYGAPGRNLTAETKARPHR